MRVFCVHYFFLRNGNLTVMPPRTVDDLRNAGVMTAVDGKPQGELIQMNWEPESDGMTWIGETELSDSIRAMAHITDGIPDQENRFCEVYRESIGKEAIQ